MIIFWIHRIFNADLGITVSKIFEKKNDDQIFVHP